MKCALHKYSQKGNTNVNILIFCVRGHATRLCHFGRIFTRSSAQAPTEKPIFNGKTRIFYTRRQVFDGQCTGRYRIWPNGRRVATSTSTLTAYLHAVLHRRRPRDQYSIGKHKDSIPRGQFLTACARDSIEFGQTAAEWRRRHPL